MSNYSIPIEELLPLTLLEMEKRIKEAKRVCVGSLTLSELASHKTHPNGAYVFFQKDCSEPFYVGRASSRSFLGRLPSHFEPLEHFWMNALSKNLMTDGGCTYEQGVASALSCELLLIGFKYPEHKHDLILRKKRINEFELILQRQLKPKSNWKESSYTGNELLALLLPTIVKTEATKVTKVG